MKRTMLPDMSAVARRAKEEGELHPKLHHQNADAPLHKRRYAQTTKTGKPTNSLVFVTYDHNTQIISSLSCCLRPCWRSDRHFRLPATDERARS